MPVSFSIAIFWLGDCFQGNITNTEGSTWENSLFYFRWELCPSIIAKEMRSILHWKVLTMHLCLKYTEPVQSDICQEMELQSKAPPKPDPVNQERYNKTLGSKNL